MDRVLFFCHDGRSAYLCRNVAGGLSIGDDSFSVRVPGHRPFRGGKGNTGDSPGI